jgi:hypothetical protein
MLSILKARLSSRYIPGPETQGNLCGSDRGETPPVIHSRVRVAELGNPERTRALGRSGRSIRTGYHATGSMGV